jgi:hypothetical protein
MENLVNSDSLTDRCNRRGSSVMTGHQLGVVAPEVHRADGAD